MDKTYGTISIFESCPSTRTRGLKFPRPRWIINRHHVDDARANIEFPGAPSIDRYLAIVPGDRDLRGANSSVSFIKPLSGLTNVPYLRYKCVHATKIYVTFP